MDTNADFLDEIPSEQSAPMNPGLSEVSAPQPSPTMMSPAQIQNGPPIEPLTRIMGYDPAEWEKFVDEWVSGALKGKYTKVMRYSGANDHGIDVAAFTDDQYLLGVWDNYQCKHYRDSITPSTAWPEIGKMLWFSYSKQFVPPRAYYFVAPRGTGTTLSQYLTNSGLLKSTLVEVWSKSVEGAIITKKAVKLEGEFKDYVDSFDFSIFKPMSPREIIEQHRKTHYFIGRFGGGLPPRPLTDYPPDDVTASESTYVAHLLAAYADHTKSNVPDVGTLKTWKPLEDHFKRQRECFYHAEALRVFVRDKVEPGTFESLQDEIFHSVIDVCDATYPDGFVCVKEVTQAAQNTPVDAHPLGSRALIKDKRGICHQLANENRLKWTR